MTSKCRICRFIHFSCFPKEEMTLRKQMNFSISFNIYFNPCVCVPLPVHMHVLILKIFLNFERIYYRIISENFNKIL